MLGAEFSPGDNISGTLELDGFSHFMGLLVGYNYRGWAEIFLEAGCASGRFTEASKQDQRGDKQPP